MAKKNSFSGMKFLTVPKVVVYPAAAERKKMSTYPVVNERTVLAATSICVRFAVTTNYPNGNEGL